jgi:pimeloyl-ACP methyl ester carboxylesterase
MGSTDVVTPEGRFTATISGPTDGPLVILLHGFPQSRHTWREQVPWLAANGYRAVAPDGRGYSGGVRPDPATDLAAYGLPRLVEDVLDIADECGAALAPFHLVGHDWGGQVAWAVADRHPDRLASLTVLSRPHPTAFRKAIQADADDQRHRSRHHGRFHDPATAGLLLEGDARRLRASLSDSGVPADHIEEYLSVVGNHEVLEAALAWYRAAGQLADHTVGPIDVPTLYLWGDTDATVGPTAAHTTAQFVRGPYRFETLSGIGHFITDQAPDAVNSILLAHLQAHPAVI